MLDAPGTIETMLIAIGRVKTRSRHSTKISVTAASPTRNMECPEPNIAPRGLVELGAVRLWSKEGEAGVAELQEKHNRLRDGH